LESVNYDELSKNLTKISKSLKITSRVSFLYDVGSDFKNAIETGNWRPLFITLEKSAVDVGVAKIVALMFSFMLVCLLVSGGLQLSQVLFLLT
ncbi:colicin-5, partial [Escherichia coli H252]